MAELPPLPQRLLDDLVPEGIERRLKPQRFLFGRPPVLCDTGVFVQNLKSLHQHAGVSKIEVPLTQKTPAHQILEIVPSIFGPLGRHPLPGHLQKTLECLPVCPVIRLLIAPPHKLHLRVKRQRIKGFLELFCREAGLLQRHKSLIVFEPGLHQILMPAVLPEDGVFDLLKFFKIGVERDLDRPLPQDLRTEGVDGPDKGLLQVMEGL